MYIRDRVLWSRPFHLFFRGPCSMFLGKTDDAAENEKKFNPGHQTKTRSDRPLILHSFFFTNYLFASFILLCLIQVFRFVFTFSTVLFNWYFALPPTSAPYFNMDHFPLSGHPSFPPFPPLKNYRLTSDWDIVQLEEINPFFSRVTAMGGGALLKLQAASSLQTHRFSLQNRTFPAGLSIRKIIVILDLYC